jgi:hypothetical protein
MAGKRTSFNFKAAHTLVAQTGNRLPQQGSGTQPPTIRDANSTPFYTEPEMNGKP